MQSIKRENFNELVEFSVIHLFGSIQIRLNEHRTVVIVVYNVQCSYIVWSFVSSVQQFAILLLQLFQWIAINGYLSLVFLIDNVN